MLEADIKSVKAYIHKCVRLTLYVLQADLEEAVKKHVYDTDLCMCYRQTQYRHTYTICKLYMLETDFTSVYSIYMINNSVHAGDRFHVCIKHIHEN